MQQRRRSGIILGLLALGLLAGAALTAHPAQAVDAVGPYYALPSWDRKIGAVNRFVVLTNWASAAVLDKETGLVWEKSPDPITRFTWNNSRFECLQHTTGGRKGWRLPSVDELESVMDPAHTNPALPPGHPFPNVVNSFYWSATTMVPNPLDPNTNAYAWFVDFGAGTVLNGFKSGTAWLWCVRGGNNADQY